MLSQIESSAIIAVSDLERAKKFYGETLGLAANGGQGDSVVQYRTGKTALVIYASPYAGTNKANAVVWGVGDQLEAIVADLRGKGVQFEHYPDMGADYRDGIHWHGDAGMAWFKDPDGNILHINSM